MFYQIKYYILYNKSLKEIKSKSTVKVPQLSYFHLNIANDFIKISQLISQLIVEVHSNDFILIRNCDFINAYQRIIDKRALNY